VVRAACRLTGKPNSSPRAAAAGKRRGANAHCDQPAPAPVPPAPAIARNRRCRSRRPQRRDCRSTVLPPNPLRQSTRIWECGSAIRRCGGDRLRARRLDAVQVVASSIRPLNSEAASARHWSLGRHQWRHIVRHDQVPPRAGRGCRRLLYRRVVIADVWIRCGICVTMSCGSRCAPVRRPRRPARQCCTGTCLRQAPTSARIHPEPMVGATGR